MIPIYKVGDKICIIGNSNEHGLNIGAIVEVEGVEHFRDGKICYMHKGWAIDQDDAMLYYIGPGHLCRLEDEKEPEKLIDDSNYNKTNVLLQGHIDSPIKVYYLGNRAYRIVCNKYDKVFYNYEQERVDLKIKELLNVLG